MRMGPHSQARSSSGKPSPSKSLQMAALTNPICSRSLVFASSNTSLPARARKILELAASGYLPARTRPPTNKSRLPSPSKSPQASGPELSRPPPPTNKQSEIPIAIKTAPAGGPVVVLGSRDDIGPLAWGDLDGDGNLDLF